MSNDILEKGKSMPIGTIHNGFKKVAEGKWRKVSEHGMTKEEHSDAESFHLKHGLGAPNAEWRRQHYADVDKHKEAASKLDSKEYSDQEVLGEEKIDEIFRLKNDKDMPISLHSLKNKDLKSLGTKEVNFASGKQTYHIFESDGEKIEVPERFLDKKSKNKEVEKALTTLSIAHLQGSIDDDTIEKARSQAGVYANTHQNRKLGRVGQKYKEGEGGDDFKHHRLMAGYHATKEKEINTEQEDLRSSSDKNLHKEADKLEEKRKFHESKEIEHKKKAQELHDPKVHGSWNSTLPSEEEAVKYGESHKDKEGEEKEETKLPEKIENFLAKFPDNTKSWAEATDEIRDMARTAKEYYNELDLNLTNDEVEGGKGQQPLNFRSIKTPSEWNTKGKQYIREVYNKMTSQTKEQFEERFSEWFKDSKEGKHISDMKYSEKLAWAKELGIKKPESLSLKELKNQIIDHNVKKQLEEFKGKSKDSTSIKIDITDAPIGAVASGGGYSDWEKIGRNSWKNSKTGALSHDEGLFSRIGTFNDFKIKLKSR